MKGNMDIKALLVAVYRDKEVAKTCADILLHYSLTAWLQLIQSEKYGAAVKNAVLNDKGVNVNTQSVEMFNELAQELNRMTQAMVNKASFAAQALVTYYAGMCLDKSCGNRPGQQQLLLERAFQMAADEASGMWPSDRELIGSLVLSDILRCGFRTWNEDLYVQLMAKLEFTHVDADRRNWLAIRMATKGQIGDAHNIIADVTMDRDKWSKPDDIALAYDLRGEFQSLSNGSSGRTHGHKGVLR